MDGLDAGDWPRADPRQQALLIAVSLAMLGQGARVLARRRPALLAVWCAALITWGFLPKYLICTRCENYGKACDFTWGGRFAARLYSRQPHRSFGLSGALAEGVPGLTVLALPVLAARDKPSEALPYLLLMSMWQAVLLGICCVKCVRHSRDPWKARFCPSYRLAALILRALQGTR